MGRPSPHMGGRPPLALLVIATALLLGSASGDFLPWESDEFMQTRQFSILKHALRVVGPDALSELGADTTLIAPVDQAWVVLTRKLGITMAQLRANKPLLTLLVKYHIVPGVSVHDMQHLGSVKGYPDMDHDWWLPTALDVDAEGVQEYATSPNNLRMFSREGGSKLSFRGFASATSKVTVPFPEVDLLRVETVLIPKIGPFANCKTVGELVSGNANLTYLQSALQAGGLWETVSKKTFEATVFAPTNEAITKAAQALNTSLDALLASPQQLVPLLQYHAAPVRLYNSNIHDGRRISTLLPGEENYLQADLTSVPGAFIMEAGNSSARVVTTDLFACKAVVHVVDMLLVP